MKYPALSLAALLAALSGALLPSAARAEVEVSFNFFHDSLSPQGDWIDVGDYGYCWRPNGVNDDWAPYTDGSWAYTDGGWTWVSYEDFGGITYHYGRWTRVSGEGWCWVPGYEWAPAWVSWRSNDDYVGWAPLPPEAQWRPSVGFSIWVDNSYDIGPDNYRFCHTRDFGAPVLGPVLIQRSENVTIINNTVNITNITYNQRNSVIFNGGPNFTNINRRVNRPIPALRLVRGDRAGGGRRGGQALRGNQLEVFAPRVNRPKNREDFGVRGARVVSADKVNRGWANSKDPEARQRLKDKYARESSGRTPENAPAREVAAQDLDVLPAKADPNTRPATVGRRPDKEDRPKQRGNVGRDGDNVADGTPDRPNQQAETPAANDRPDRQPKGEVADDRVGKVRGEQLGARRNGQRRGDGVDATAAAAEREDATPGQANRLRPFEDREQGQPDRANRDRNAAVESNNAARQAQRENAGADDSAARELRRQQRDQAEQQQATAARRQQENSNRQNEARQQQAQAVQRQQQQQLTREAMNRDNNARREQQQAVRQQPQNYARQQQQQQAQRRPAAQGQRAPQPQRQMQRPPQAQPRPQAAQNNGGGKNQGGNGNGKKKEKDE